MAKLSRLLAAAVFCYLTFEASADLDRSEATLFLDFEQGHAGYELIQGAWLKSGKFGQALEFTKASQYVIPTEGQGRFENLTSMTIGGWFFLRRKGEQALFFRGEPEIGSLGERFFRPESDWVNFVLGTDERGFLYGTINGNGIMPFPKVTVNEVSVDAWQQLVITKSTNGVHQFFINGTLVHSDNHAITSGKTWPFKDVAPTPAIRLAVPLGGLVGEAWIFPRALSLEEIKKDFEAKRSQYNPALPGKAVLLREMNMHPMDGLWKQNITSRSWATEKRRITEAAMKILGPFPKEKPPLKPEVVSEEDCGTHVRRKVRLQVQQDDIMPAYVLIPKKRKGRVPAIICFYGTTSGAGKETTVGLSGRSPGSPPHPNNAFAIDMVEAGFVALAADYLRDGERIKPGRKPYDTTDFYKEFPDWSIHGKDIWDTSRAIDYLETLNFVDSKKIGMTGHSYGGHSTIFTTALEPRIKVAVANGPVSDFLHHGLHWAVPKGAGNSQSMPALRPYVMDHTLPLPLTFYEFTALIAPRPLLVGQAAGERRPMEEENYAAVHQVYDALGASARVRYHWYAGDHDYPPEARQAAVAWFKHWFSE